MTPTEATGDSRFQTRDWDAALAELNAAQGFDPAAAGGEPAQDQAATEPEPAGEPTPRAEAGQETPPPDTEAEPAPTAEEVRISKKEWEETQRRLNQYGQNLQQQRAEFEQRVQQALAGQGPDIERRMADARREGERAAWRTQIAAINDPAIRREWEQQKQAEWDAEDRQLAADRARAEADQIKTQAGQQIQQAQQVVQQAQAQMVASAMGEYLAGFAPQFAQMTSQILGEDADPEEVKAFVTRPEIVKLAAQEAYNGPEAVNRFGFTVANMAAIHLRDRKAAREEAAKARREERNASGLGREQGGANGARPPVDLNQFKSSKDKQGDFDGMLKALNEQQGIAVAR